VGHVGRAADARTRGQRPSRAFHPCENQRSFASFLALLLALGSMVFLLMSARRVCESIPCQKHRSVEATKLSNRGHFGAIVSECLLFSVLWPVYAGLCRLAVVRISHNEDDPACLFKKFHNGYQFKVHRMHFFMFSASPVPATLSLLCVFNRRKLSHEECLN
jgi:hypothetical protein